MQKRWITVKEVADYLSIHPVTCRRLIAQKKIPAIKIGGSVRVDLKSLERQMIEGNQDET